MKYSSNHQIYRELVKILKEVQEGRMGQAGEREKKKWWMMVE